MPKAADARIGAESTEKLHLGSPASGIWGHRMAGGSLISVQSLTLVTLPQTWTPKTNASQDTAPQPGHRVFSLLRLPKWHPWTPPLGYPMSKTRCLPQKEQKRAIISLQLLPPPSGYHPG